MLGASFILLVSGLSSHVLAQRGEPIGANSTEGVLISKNGPSCDDIDQSMESEDCCLVDAGEYKDGDRANRAKFTLWSDDELEKNTEQIRFADVRHAWNENRTSGDLSSWWAGGLQMTALAMGWEGQEKKNSWEGGGQGWRALHMLTGKEACKTAFDGDRARKGEMWELLKACRNTPTLIGTAGATPVKLAKTHMYTVLEVRRKRGKQEVYLFDPQEGKKWWDWDTICTEVGTVHYLKNEARIKRGERVD